MKTIKLELEASVHLVSRFLDKLNTSFYLWFQGYDIPTNFANKQCFSFKQEGFFSQILFLNHNIHYHVFKSQYSLSWFKSQY